jgi:hypothetical protein
MYPRISNTGITVNKQVTVMRSGEREREREVSGSERHSNG